MLSGWALAAMLLLGASWLMPLHFLPWVSWHSEVPVFAAVFLLAFGEFASRAWRGRGQPWQLRLPASILLWPALCLLVVLQWLGGQIGFGGDALVLGLYFVLCGLSWGLGYGAGPMGQDGLARRQQALEAMAWTLVAGASASAVIALVQVADVWESVSWISRMPNLRRPGANLNQPNQLATLLIMGLASLLFLHQLKRLGIVASGAVFLLIAIGIAATESRTGLLSLALMSLWCVAGRWRMGLGLRPWAVGVALLFFVALFFAWPVLMSSGEQFGPGAQLNTKAGLRLVVWPQLMEAIALKPWAGWGLREVSSAHNAVAGGYLVSEPYIYAHNLGLELAIGAGVPVALLLSILAVVWVWRRLRMCQDIWAWYCVAAVLPVAVHSMLEFPYAYAYFLAPVMFFMGSLESMSGAHLTVRASGRKMGLFVLAVSAVLLVSAVEYLKIEEDFRVVRFESLHVGKTVADYERPEVLLLTQLDALLDAGRIVPRAGMAPDEMEVARKAAMRFPWPAIQNRYALSLALNGQVEEAQRQLRVMRALHGEKKYADIIANWQAIGQKDQPLLREVQLP